MSGILGNIRWLLIIAMLGGPVFAYLGHSDGKRLEMLKTEGVTVEAYIESAFEKRGRRGSKSYEVDLAWEDADGEVRRASGVNISNAFAGNLIEGDELVVEALEVLYLPGDTSVEPAVAGDLKAQIGNSDFMFKGGIVAGIVGLIGSVLFFMMGRRRKEAA